MSKFTEQARDTWEEFVSDFKFEWEFRALREMTIILVGCVSLISFVLFVHP